ncbi:diguanylate cyclase/phosphodiesterase [Psychromonas ingrahamii 37]|uniref:cyclic-guanylate-specific phosphodiesterase n=1 Tax=Psychromonas ingrahamii (strain DSM 17664 / CCUG 51855 / 37) TaxID=357804 RepID=A1SV51_PSYIN|nr:EAL domain-containing protein [Psychromonas ingrahamii]ABM03366.1 diguanylate cyclase/phosphodiesterase [Psychromonas ingrahamii 37]
MNRNNLKSSLAELVNTEFSLQNEENNKWAVELAIANRKLAFQNEEKDKRAAELDIANKELAFQNEEKDKRAAELVIANRKLAFQNEEKDKRAAELDIANKEKDKRAAELAIANKELAFQNEEKDKRAAELAIANKELAFQNEEKSKRAAELAIANKELAFQNEEKSKRAEELNDLAFYDALTGLPNRRILIDRLHHALSSNVRQGFESAVMFIDLDHFKDINDTLGHEVGDLLLIQIAQRLESCLRKCDTVARLGGDEFVLILENLDQKTIEAAAKANFIADKIFAALNKPYQLDMHECYSTVSIGLAFFGHEGKTAEGLLKQADIAMYQAKKAGGNTMRFFNQKMQDIINVRTSLEHELRIAVAKSQFNLYYQIQMDSSNRVWGAEALIRWVHPERGLVSPATFIPLAEETGLILPIGQWVIETACAQIKIWQKESLTRDLTLSVNVSAKQFRQTDFVDQVQSAVRRHAISANLLKLELTESLFQEDIKVTIATMNALNNIGIQFSLDDFGTGYSSLQYLKQLPLDQIKIDQSFVRDIAIDSNDRAIVKAIIAMAHILKIDVIAEGVETEEQRQLLLGKGCSFFQGYLFSKPIPIEQFEALIRSGSEFN